MKNIILALTVVCTFGCAKIDKTLESANSIPGKMDSLNSGMANTNENVRLQKLAMAEGMLMDEKHHVFLTPIPGDMMAPGKIFAETLTTEEALEWSYINLKKVNEDIFVSQDPALQEAFDKKKQGLLMAITVACGFLPDATVDDMIKNHIQKSDRYRNTGLNILALRGKFYNEVMLKGSLFNEEFVTTGHLAKAIEYNSKLEVIARLPYVSLVAVKISGFANQDNNTKFSFTFEKKVVLKNWNKMQQLAEASFVAEGMSGDAQSDKNEVQRQNDVFASQLKIVAAKIAAWENTLN